MFFFSFARIYTSSLHIRERFFRMICLITRILVYLGRFIVGLYAGEYKGNNSLNQIFTNEFSNWVNFNNIVSLFFFCYFYT